MIDKVQERRKQLMRELNDGIEYGYMDYPTQQAYKMYISALDFVLDLEGVTPWI